MTKSDQQLTADIERHFGRRLHTIIHDTADTCARADFRAAEIVELVMAGLFFELVRCGAVLDLDEDGFLKGCRIAYRAMMPLVEQMQQQPDHQDP